MTEFRVLGSARRDLVEILAHSRRRFGSEPASRYEVLVLRAFAMVRDQPFAQVTRPHGLEKRGLRVLHLRNVGQTSPRPVRRPRHLVVFRVKADRITVVRILHERMELERHIP